MSWFWTYENKGHFRLWKCCLSFFCIKQCWYKLFQSEYGIYCLTSFFAPRRLPRRVYYGWLLAVMVRPSVRPFVRPFVRPSVRYHPYLKIEKSFLNAVFCVWMDILVVRTIRKIIWVVQNFLVPFLKYIKIYPYFKKDLQKVNRVLIFLNRPSF